MSQKRIYLLLGPKGSGKSYIGRLLEKHFAIPFIQVEPWVIKVRKGRDITNEAFITEVFSIIEEGIRTALESQDVLAFESTGLSANFDQMLRHLKDDFEVITIGVKAKAATCLQRVRDRDSKAHITVTDAEVLIINDEVMAKAIRTDFDIDNERASEEELMAALHQIF